MTDKTKKTEEYDELLDEIQNDIRHERMKSLWNKYGKIFSSVFTGALALGAAYTLWENHKATRRLENSVVFMAAQDLISKGDVDKAITALGTLKDGSGSYGHLTYFLEASAYLKNPSDDNKKKALEAFQNLAKNPDLDVLWRDLAHVLSLSLDMDINGETHYSDILTQLEPFTKKESPWYYLASELKGAVYHAKGDALAAAQIFSDLAADKDTPDGVRTRSQLMAQVLSAAVES